MIGGCRRAPRCDLGCSGATFKRRWADLAQGRMTPPLVIEHFDVVEQLHLGFSAAVEVLAELELHGGEETLHHRVEAPMCQDCCSTGCHAAALTVWRDRWSARRARKISRATNRLRQRMMSFL